MGKKEYIGYHATQKEKKQSIILNGFNKSISSKNRQHWLGSGVYFFEDDYYAVEWNLLDLYNNKKYGIDIECQKYIILKSIIICEQDKLLDMSSPEGFALYKYLKRNIKQKYINQGKSKDIERLNKASTKFWMNLLEDKGFFKDFKVVIASYARKNQVLKNDDDFIKNHQRQICVKDIHCIVDTQEYEEFGRIEELQKVIIRNRKLELGECYE